MTEKWLENILHSVIFIDEKFYIFYHVRFEGADVICRPSLVFHLFCDMLFRAVSNVITT